MRRTAWCKRRISRPTTSVKLKKKAMSLPVIGLLSERWQAFSHPHVCGEKKQSGPLPRSRALPGSWVNSSIFRFIIEILITLAFPSLKKMGIGLAGKKFPQSVQITGFSGQYSGFLPLLEKGSGIPQP